MGSAERFQKPSPNSPTPPPSVPQHTLTTEEVAFLKRREAVGKISLHQIPFTNTSPLTTNSLAIDSLTFNPPIQSTSTPLGFV
jgi:hypothetical protein